MTWSERVISIFKTEAESFLKSYQKEIPGLLAYHAEHPFGDKDKSKLARKIIHCQNILIRCDRLQKAVETNDIQKAIRETAWLGTLSYNAGLSKVGSSVLGRIRGGKADKANKALDFIVHDALKKSKIKTANGLWNYVKKTYSNDVKSQYGMIWFIDIDDRDSNLYKKEGIMVSKKTPSNRRHLGIIKELFIDFDTFKRYAYTHKKAERRAPLC